MSERIGYKNEIIKYETLQEKRALAIKFLCDGYKVQDISKQIGISVAQLRQWNKEPAFLKDRYVEMQLRMGEMAQEALETLREVMNDKEARAGDRVKAAAEVLDRSGFVVNKQIDMSINTTEAGNALKNMSDSDIMRLLSQLEKQGNAIDVTPEEDSKEST